MFDNIRRFGRIRSVISVGSVRFGSVTGFIHSPHSRLTIGKQTNFQFQSDLLNELAAEGAETGAFLYRNGPDYRNGLPEWTFICIIGYLLFGF